MSNPDSTPVSSQISQDNQSSFSSPLSQSQNQDTNVFKIYLWTLGSCSNGNAEILYPKHVSMGQLLTLSKRNGEIDIGFAKLKCEYADSRKNLHRTIYVYPKEPLVIRKWGQRSCNPNSVFDEVYLVTPEGSEQLEIQQEIKEIEDQKYKRKVVVYYVEYNGQRFELSQKELEREVKLEAMKIVIEINGNKVIVKGDTYHIRSILKGLSFKWNPSEKVWERNDTDIDDLQYELDQKKIQYEIKNS